MSDFRISALAVRIEPARAWTVNTFGNITDAFTQAGSWAVDTALHFGAFVSALMAPAVFSAYAFVIWCLAENLGWTDTFPFATGPLSNWLMWAGIAIAVHLASQVLKRHVVNERGSERV